MFNATPVKPDAASGSSGIQGSERQGRSTPPTIARAGSPEIHPQPGAPSGSSGFVSFAQTDKREIRPGFTTPMSIHQMRTWLSANSVRFEVQHDDSVRIAFTAAVQRLAKPQHRLGRSLTNPQAGLYLRPRDDEALVITIDATGQVLHAELPTPLESQVDLAESLYHLLDKGKLHINHEGLNRIERDQLTIDPHAEPTENSVGTMTLHANELLDRMPDDLTPDRFEAQPFDAGNEKELFRLKDRADFVLLLLRTENDATGGVLRRKDLETEIHALQQLQGLGLPVPRIKPQILLVRTASGERRWGYLQENLSGAIPSHANPAAHLNERSVADARRWIKTLQARQLQLNDPQVLVPADGRLLGIDPKGLSDGVSERQIKHFEALIEAAQAKLASQPGAIGDWSSAADARRRAPRGY